MQLVLKLSLRLTHFSPISHYTHVQELSSKVRGGAGALNPPPTQIIGGALRLEISGGAVEIRLR